MQALLLFLTIFFGIFGAAVFVRITYNAVLEIISKRKERHNAGRK